MDTTQLAHTYLGQDEVVTRSLLEEASARGDAEAQYRLGMMHRSAQGGLEANEAAATHLFNQAAAQGHTESQFLMGMIYGKKAGIFPQDESKACELFVLAARKGHKGAQIALTKLAEGKFFQAQTQMGMMYAQGWEGVAQDFALAATWFVRAAEAGEAQASYQWPAVGIWPRPTPR